MQEQSRSEDPPQSDFSAALWQVPCHYLSAKASLCIALRHASGEPVLMVARQAARQLLAERPARSSQAQEVLHLQFLAHDNAPQARKGVVVVHLLALWRSGLQSGWLRMLRSLAGQQEAAGSHDHHF